VLLEGWGFLVGLCGALILPDLVHVAFCSGQGMGWMLLECCRRESWEARDVVLVQSILQCGDGWGEQSCMLEGYSFSWGCRIGGIVG
jgi:hypothetical protein